VAPVVANVVRDHIVHHQPLKVECLVEGALVCEEAQFASLNFKYRNDAEVPIVCYKNKWDENWNHYWFYHTVKDDELPLVRACTQLDNLPKGVATAYGDGDRDHLLFTCFQELMRTYATRDLVEEFCGAKIFPVHAGWSVVAWNDFVSPIKIPDFSKSFRLEA
jgi:hypothetical protein